MCERGGGAARVDLMMTMIEEVGGCRFGDHAPALLSEIAQVGAQTTGKLKARQSPGLARAPRLPRLTGCASGSRRSPDGGWLQVTMSDTLLIARHLVPLCMGPKLRTRSLDWLHLLDCPIR